MYGDNTRPLPDSVCDDCALPYGTTVEQLDRAKAQYKSLEQTADTAFGTDYGQLNGWLRHQLEQTAKDYIERGGNYGSWIWTFDVVMTFAAVANWLIQEDDKQGTFDDDDLKKVMNRLMTGIAPHYCALTMAEIIVDLGYGPQAQDWLNATLENA